MHIPDGYLSPQTIIASYIITIPFAWYSLTRIKKEDTANTIPKIALFSAFSFVIMMFNIPLPGGTTGHATGAALASLILGPEYAFIAIGIALFIQALFFGDGGILSLGANILTMAIIIPYVTWGIFTLINSRISSKSFSSALSSYFGLNVGAFVTALLLGIQPILFHSSDGSPLYFPFDLRVSIPAMMIGHLLIVGFAEALISSSTIGWILRIKPNILPWSANTQVHVLFANKIWMGIIALVLLTPLGLLAPGTAWGEWNRSELISQGLSAIPEGYDRLNKIFLAPMPGYIIQSIPKPISYILSGVFGIFFCFFFFFILKKLLSISIFHHKNKNSV
jgi:cobalt/nickel transport system permease protein